MSETKHSPLQPETNDQNEKQPFLKRTSTKVGGAALAVIATLGVGVGVGSSMGGESPAPKAPETSAPAEPSEKKTDKPGESETPNQPEQGANLTVADSDALNPSSVERIEDTISPVNIDKLAAWTASPMGPEAFEPLVDEAVTEDLMYNNGELNQVMQQFQLYDQYRFEGNEGMWRDVYNREFVRKAELYGGELPAADADAIGEMHYITREDVNNAVESGDATDMVRTLLHDVNASMYRAQSLFANHMIETKGEIDENYVGSTVADIFQMGRLDDIQRSEELAASIEYARELYFGQGEKAFLKEFSPDAYKQAEGDNPFNIDKATILDVADITVHTSDNFDDGEDVQRQTFLKVLVHDGKYDQDVLYNIALIDAPVKDGESVAATQALVLGSSAV